MSASVDRRSAPATAFLDRRFGFSARGSSLRIEALGGVSTFLTMSYILFVNPAILSAAGLPFSAVAVGTALAAAVATLAMGVIANYPFALASGLGLNAVVAGTSLFGGRGSAWHALLGALVIGSIANGMDLLGLVSSVKFMITGGVLLAAVVLDALIKIQREKAGAVR